MVLDCSSAIHRHKIILFVSVTKQISFVAPGLLAVNGKEIRTSLHTKLNTKNYCIDGMRMFM